MDHPDIDVGFNQPDLVAPKRPADVDLLAAETNMTGDPDALLHVTCWIGQPGHIVRVAALGYFVVVGRYGLLECFVRSQLVKEGHELVEAALLIIHIGFGRTRRLLFECQMHALVSAVLLGFSRLDALVLDPERQPPR